MYNQSNDSVHFLVPYFFSVYCKVKHFETSLLQGLHAITSVDNSLHERYVKREYSATCIIDRLISNR